MKPASTVSQALKIMLTSRSIAPVSQNVSASILKGADADLHRIFINITFGVEDISFLSGVSKGG